MGTLITYLISLTTAIGFSLVGLTLPAILAGSVAMIVWAVCVSRRSSEWPARSRAGFGS